MPEISVIVPVFNVEKYLHKCVDSILNQTYQDFELILIDDGSTDNCPRICDEYTKIDDRVIVIHKKNGGVSSARNAGLDIAKGDYISFVDGDDYISKDMLFILINTIKDNKTSAIRFNYTSSPNSLLDKVESSYKTILYKVNNENLKYDFLHNMLLNGKIGWESWSYLYDHSIIRNNKLRFPIGIDFAEDMYFTSLFFSFSESLMHLEIVLYFYQLREDSAMRSIKETMLNTMNELSFLLEKNLNLKDKSMYPYLHSLIINNRLCLLPPLSSYKALIIWIKEIKRINNIQFMREKYSSMYNKEKHNVDFFSLDWMTMLFLKSKGHCLFFFIIPLFNLKRIIRRMVKLTKRLF